MADAGVGVFVWRMNNCGILALVYKGGGEGEGGLTFLFVYHSKVHCPEAEKEGSSTAAAAAH